VIDGALARLSGLPGADRVTVERRYADKVPPLPGDPARLEQMVLNLAVNAMEAMGEGGRLTITTRRGAGAVEIEVRDTGPGIPAENLERIFKPFFSTKALGTGLGLPLVARVVAAHGGRVTVESEVGRGTAFHVTLPLAGDGAGAGDMAAGDGPGPDAAAPNSGGGKA